MDILEFQNKVKEDIEKLCDNTSFDGTVIRGMLTELGVSRANAILESVMEGSRNGNARPYPVLRFHITLAKNVDPEIFERVAYNLNQLNIVVAGMEYPSLGNFCLFMPKGQIFMVYRMPVNEECLEKELENVRYYLGTLYEQLDIFADMILFIAEGKREMTMDDYLDYLSSLENIDDIEERAEKLQKKLEDLLASGGE